MSRIGKKPVQLPGGVNVSVAGQAVEVSGPKGKLHWSAPSGIAVALDDGKKVVQVSRLKDSGQFRALHGLTRALVANMVRGVHEGFSKKLEVYGTGYGCDVKGRILNLNVGFMGRGGKNKPQFSIEIPQGVDVSIEVAAARGESDPAKMTISGCDKQAVGQFAARIRKIRPPEPYKGKGIRYSDEVVKRKQGKALAGAGR
jgi:large subunit ribosomal protein L6